MQDHKPRRKFRQKTLSDRNHSDVFESLSYSEGNKAQTNGTQLNLQVFPQQKGNHLQTEKTISWIGERNYK